MTKTLAHELASLARQLKTGGEDTATQSLVKQCLIDAAAAAVAGYDSPAAGMAARFAVRGFGHGAVSPWFSDDLRLSAIGAAFVNSSAMSSLDIDDGNRAARGHLGAAVIPAASIFGSLSGASSATFAHAITAGCEIGARLGAAETPPFFASGRWAGVGAAVAAGICLGFDEAQLANVISLSIHTAPLMAAAGVRSQMTGHIKEGVPFGVLSGLSSALLADEGFRGDPDAIESTGIYDTKQLAWQLGHTPAFMRTYFKRYTCCRLAHSPIDAAVAIAVRERLDWRDIERITVRTFRTAIELPNETRPASFESAQFSLPFTIAAALARGPEALLPLSTKILECNDVIGLAERVVLEHDTNMDVQYPSGTPSGVQITTSDGRSFEEQRETADGDPGRPFSNTQLLKKLEILGRDKVGSRHLARILACLDGGIPDATSFETALRR